MKSDCGTKVDISERGLFVIAEIFFDEAWRILSTELATTEQASRNQALEDFAVMIGRRASEHYDCYRRSKSTQDLDRGIEAEQIMNLAREQKIN